MELITLNVFFLISDEIDDDLLNYLESLIQKELMRAAGPVYDDEVVEEGLSGIGKNAIEVLRMVQRRLEAEVKVKNNEEVKLLADLLRIEDYQVRTAALISICATVFSVFCFMFVVIIF